MVRSREELIAEVREGETSPATVTEHARRLRLELGEACDVTVESIRGVGYRLSTPT